ncbi:MAG: hypothetical protein JW732_06130 [Dehalococcoidia bacterium]|nr:hypothetical protein [Dehalococcoidia bacterium]
MRIYNLYIVILALVLCATNILLAAFGQNSLEVYFIANIVAYLIISLLYAHLNPRAKSVLGTMTRVLFGGFLVIVALKVIEVLR